MDEISQLKSVLRSLVVSSPNEVNMRTLLRDYKDMMGQDMPIRKFGYKEPLAFLKERCSDCFVFSGNPSNPVLILIVPETLKHIDEFVQKQKRPASTKKKRQSIPDSKTKTPVKAQGCNLIFESFNSKYTQEPNNMKQYTPEPEQVKITDSVKCSNPFVNGSGQEKCDKTVNEKADIMENIQNSCENVSSANGSNNALHNFLKKRIPGYDNSESNILDSNSKSNMDEVDSGRQTSSSNCSWKSAKFEQLKSEISELIGESPEGVLCTDLMELYRKKFMKELEYGRLGYTSIVNALYAMNDVVALSRLSDTGDWLARHPAAPTPSAPPAPRARRPHAHAPVDPEDALPGIAYDPDVFPEDCMQLTDTLPPPPLEDVTPGTLLEVMVGEVYSPSHFWLIRLGEQHHQAMEEMMDEMTEYYSSGAGAGRVLALGAARVGQHCACVYEGDWHRAVVVRVLDADTVKVRLVDYGTVEQTAWRALRALRRRWAALPAQAVRARLAGVAPRALHWPRAAAHRLLRRVHCKHLVAHVAAVGTQEKILEVFLVDTTGEEDLCLADDLINSGHAEPRQYSSLSMSECYLYPRFEALETGATPNFGEIEVYLRHGIELQYVEDYRRHVPAALPPPSLARSPSPPTPPPSPPPTPPSQVPPTNIPLLPTCNALQSAGAPAGALSVGGVRLSLAECETYRMLCATAPMAAHAFMVNAISRSLASTSLSQPPPTPSSLSPHSAPFMPPISLMRPPPGFEPM